MVFKNRNSKCKFYACPFSTQILLSSYRVSINKFCLIWKRNPPKVRIEFDRIKIPGCLWCDVHFHRNAQSYNAIYLGTNWGPIPFQIIYFIIPVIFLFSGYHWYVFYGQWRLQRQWSVSYNQPGLLHISLHGYDTPLSGSSRSFSLNITRRFPLDRRDIGVFRPLRRGCARLKGRRILIHFNHP